MFLHFFTNLLYTDKKFLPTKGTVVGKVNFANLQESPVISKAS